MAFFWIFNMGRSKAGGFPPPYQQMWRWKGKGNITWAAGRDSDNGPCPKELASWERVATSDPRGGSGGWSGDFVGVYGNWWGVANSGGCWIGEHGIGPVDCPYIDALDEIAQDHDINCYLAVEADRLGILQVNDVICVENIWKFGRLVQSAYVIKTELNAHLEAGNRVSKLPDDLHKKLEKAMEKAPYVMRKLILGQVEQDQPLLTAGRTRGDGFSPAAGSRMPGVLGLG